MKDSHDRSRTRLSPEVRLAQPSIERPAARKHPITEAFEPLLRGMCSHPKDIEIGDELRGNVFALYLKPHMADYAIICGKGGRQINSIRFLIQEACLNLKLEGRVDLDESYIGRRDQNVPFVENDKFDISEFQKMFDQVLKTICGTLPETAYVLNQGKLKVYVAARAGQMNDHAIINALADMAYPYGWKKGRRIEVREMSKRDHTESENLNNENQTGKTTVPE